MWNFQVLVESTLVWWNDASLEDSTTSLASVRTWVWRKPVLKISVQKSDSHLFFGGKYTTKVDYLTLIRLANTIQKRCFFCCWFSALWFLQTVHFSSWLCMFHCTPAAGCYSNCSQEAGHAGNGPKSSSTCPGRRPCVCHWISKVQTNAHRLLSDWCHLISWELNVLRGAQAHLFSVCQCVHSSPVHPSLEITAVVERVQHHAALPSSINLFLKF